MVVEFMWKVTFAEDERVESEVQMAACVCLADIIKYWTIQPKVNYIQKL